MESLRIISWNLLHKSGAMVEEIAELIAGEQPHLFLMQEVTDEIEKLTSLAGGSFYRQPWPEKQHGLAIWSSEKSSSMTRPLKLPVSRVPGSFPRRMAQLFKIREITIANVHLSHGQLLNRHQLTVIAENTDGPTAIIGDFNAFGKINMRDFFDVGPEKHTHRAQRVVPFRLDRCMVRQMRCTKSTRLSKGRSDHHPIMMELMVKRDMDGESTIKVRDADNQTKRRLFWHD